MFDNYNRKITYLRISVTDRCNLRCVYCMPEEGVTLIPHDDVLRFEEIVEVVKAAVELGISKFRLTGGEPLVRKGIVELVQMIHNVKGVDELVMTTNGQLLEKYAKQLADAGMGRVNVSLDTLDPQKYSDITRGGDIESVFRGMKAAKDAGLAPVKINCVVQHSSNESDAQEVMAFARKNDYGAQFIHQMNLETGEFDIVEGGHGGDCKNCNRLRLTADGFVKPCLFSDMGYPIRELGAKKALEIAVVNKPACGTSNHTGEFYNIGG